MSDYTKIVDYAAKDALITGNPVKLVKGTELGAEYDAIATAIATKANSASPAFTGVSGFAVGAVGAPSIYMTGYATTGWYNIGANNWGFAVSGAKVLDIASTGLSVTGKIISTSNASVGSATSGVSYIKGSSAAVSTAAAGTLSYVMDANYTALVLISDDTSAKTALYLCGTDNVCTEISDPSNGFSPTNTGVVRVTKSGATITLTNDYGVSVNLAMTIVSAY